MGRPTDFCDEMQAKIIEGIEKVMVMRQVANYAGIGHASIYNWLNDGKKDIENGLVSSPKALFVYAVKEAQSKKIAELLEKIKSDKSWMAHAWILERCFRKDFGKDAGVILDLVAKCDKLEEAHKRLSENVISLQGVTQNG